MLLLCVYDWFTPFLIVVVAEDRLQELLLTLAFAVVEYCVFFKVLTDYFTLPLICIILHSVIS